MKHILSYRLNESKKLEGWDCLEDWVKNPNDYYEGIDKYAINLGKIMGVDPKYLYRISDDTSDTTLDELEIADNIIDDNYKKIGSGKVRNYDDNLVASTEEYKICLIEKLIRVLYVNDESFIMVDPTLDSYWEPLVDKAIKDANFKPIQKIYPYLSDRLRKKYRHLGTEYGFFD